MTPAWAAVPVPAQEQEQVAQALARAPVHLPVARVRERVLEPALARAAQAREQVPALVLPALLPAPAREQVPELAAEEVVVVAPEAELPAEAQQERLVLLRELPAAMVQPHLPQAIVARVVLPRQEARRPVPASAAFGDGCSEVDPTAHRLLRRRQQLGLLQMRSTLWRASISM